MIHQVKKGKEKEELGGAGERKKGGKTVLQSTTFLNKFRAIITALVEGRCQVEKVMQKSLKCLNFLVGDFLFLPLPVCVCLLANSFCFLGGGGKEREKKLFAPFLLSSAVFLRCVTEAKKLVPLPSSSFSFLLHTCIPVR